MDRESFINDDSALLARWAREGNEDAFAELVRLYQRLVIGAARRRTADAEMARDVAQQVFATLSAKARTLLGRTSIAGWLYQTASHIGARAAQAEMRRLRAHERSANELPREVGSAQWLPMEDALARLGESERESLVMHYFQDLSYPEMARALSIEEAAARKRVSRALQSLETQLRRSGVGTSAKALLVAAVAQQASIPVQAGLAVAALSAVPIASTLSIAIATLMSNTTLKIACAAMMLIAAPFALDRVANASLRTEIAQIRSANPELAALPADAGSLAKVKADLAAAHTARLAAENRSYELLDLKKKVETEVVVSMGSVETMAKKLARMMTVIESLDALKEKGAAAPASMEQRKKLAEEIAGSMGQTLAMPDELRRIEKSPDKAARFYATLCGEVAGLDEFARALIETHTRDWIRGLQNEGLALPQRPKGKAPEWDARRKAATKRLAETLSSKLPPPKPEVSTIEDILDVSDLGGVDMLGDELK